MKENGLQQELRELMEEQGYSMSAVARATGISNTTLSQWASNSYPGNVARIEEAVRSFINRQRERSRLPRRVIGFVETSVALRVFEVARICHLDGEIGVAYGAAGLGKTEAIKQYTGQNPDVILIEADLGHTAKILFSELHRRLGMDGLGTVHAMFEDVVEKLKGSGRLIIVDEAEHLPYRALELLRRVYDKAGVGVLLVGMPRLISNLRGKRGEYAQLYSRVGIAGKLETLRGEDTEAIVKAALPGSNGVWKAFHEACCGNTRVLSKLLARSLRVAELNGEAVSAAIVHQTAKMLII